MRSHLSLILCVVAYASGSLSAVAYASDSLEAAPKATLTLRMCRELALANQPAIAAAQATLEAAIDRANPRDCLRGQGQLS